MIDPKLIRERFDDVRTAYEHRHYPVEFLTRYRDLDAAWRLVKSEVEALKFERKQAAPKGKPTPEQLTQLAKMASEIKQKEELVGQLEQDVKAAALLIPNIVTADTPVGSSEDANVEQYRVGDCPSFDFTPLPHDELGVQLGVLDFERAAKVTGARFVFYKGWGAKLERALINFMLDTHTTQHGYTEVMPPIMVNDASMTGTGQLPKFAEDSFKLDGDPYRLSPTAEVQLTNMFRDEILNEADLPLSFTAYTPCFRREAGSHGRDTRGIIRQHQFNKVELVKFTTPDQSDAQLKLLLSHAEAILKALELPYRVVSLCTGDIGFSSAQTYDIEVWFPSQSKYREISSCSSFLDFQARRAMIRYRQTTTQDVSYLHTINGSGLAVGRTFAAILENYQQRDGSVRIPKVLQPYIGIEELQCQPM